MFHDIQYTVAENIGTNPKDIKNRKSDADNEWLDCFNDNFTGKSGTSATFYR